MEEATTIVLDRIVIELHVSALRSEEHQRDILRRLDASAFFRRLTAQVQKTLNSARMDDIRATLVR